MATKEDPALGVPYGYAYGQAMPPPSQPPPPQMYYVGQNPYQAGTIPPNAVYGDPKGIPLQQTMFRDTPAPFQCVYCGSSGLTTIRFRFSFAQYDSYSLFFRRCVLSTLIRLLLLRSYFAPLGSVSSCLSIRMVLGIFFFQFLRWFLIASNS